MLTAHAANKDKTMQMAILATIMAVLTAGGCAIQRFESIDTCEMERWELLGVTLWKTVNCAGTKESPTELHNQVESMRELFGEEEEE